MEVEKLTTTWFEEFFYQNYFSTIIYSDSNKSLVKNIDVKKINSKIVRTETISEFNLVKHTCKINDIDKYLVEYLKEVIKTTQQTVSLDWKTKKFFIFNSHNTSDLVSKIENSKLILTSSKIYKKISKKIKDKKIIIDDKISDEIFLAESDSLGVIINKNFTTIGDKSEFDLLIYNKNTKKILLE